MIKNMLFLLIGFYSLQSFAGNDNVPFGGRASGMGTASVMLSDFWSASINQAALVHYKYAAAGIYYENRFLLKELSLKGVAVILPTKRGTFGVNYSYFGYSLFNQNKVGLAYSMAFGRNFSTGIQLDWMNFHLGEDYGTKNAFTFEVGLLGKITEHMQAGIHLFNPINTKLSDYQNERIPTVINAGLAYDFSGKVLLCVEAEKNIYEKMNIKAGIEYHFISLSYFRAGISTQPSLVTFGMGLEIKHFMIDIAGSVHQELGFSPQLSIVYQFK